MPLSRSSNSLIRDLPWNIGVAITYFLLARVSLAFAFESSNASPIWPPSGFAFAAILLLGPRIAPGILLGAFSANLVTFVTNQTAGWPVAILTSAAIGVGNTLEAYVGYFLLNDVTQMENIFRTVKNIFRFLWIITAMSMFSCSIGTITLYLAKIITSENYPVVWLTWLTGDVSGIVLLTPLIIVWVKSLEQKNRTNKLRKIPNPAEVIAGFAAVILVSGVIFDNWFTAPFLLTRAFLVIPVLLWLALRFPLREFLSAITLCFAFAVYGTANHHGPFFTPSLNDSLITAQVFVIVMFFSKVLLHVTFREHKLNRIKLVNMRDELAEKVKDRTKELEQKNIELERSNSEMSSFTYMASHDLAEPLRKISIYSDMIRKKEAATLSVDALKYFSRIESAAERMQQLLHDLLAYSRVNTSERRFEDTDLTLILEKVKDELREAIEQKHAAIDSSPLPVLKIIPHQFVQLLVNIISNSLKYSQKDVPPRIVIKSDNVWGGTIPNANPSKVYCRLSVADNGIGFEQVYTEKIFQIFQRLHGRSEYSGTGIGLAICKKIVENHNGIITATGVLGQGATFNIYIPKED